MPMVGCEVGLGMDSGQSLFLAHPSLLETHGTDSMLMI